MKVLVTGGGGFLGSTIVRQLHERGDTVTALGRGRYPQLETLGVNCIQADIRDVEALKRAFEDMEVVFHVAAMPGIWGPRDVFWDINAGGTANVLAACRAADVPNLVYTSTPAVVFSREDLNGVDEKQPYAREHLAEYTRTKAVAERMVLRANCEDLATVALRPHLIFGPGDPHLFPRIVARARAGKLMCVGGGANKVDLTFVDDAARAHLLAADLLEPDAVCAGKAYFISQGEPITLWPWLKDVLRAADVPEPRRSISFESAYRVGAMMERIWRLLRLSSEPRMTRFLACQLSKSHHFSIAAARRDLGYEPQLTMAEATRILVAWLRGEPVSRLSPAPVRPPVRVPQTANL